MSAVSRGGITLIVSDSSTDLAPVSIPPNQTLTFTHGLNRAAFRILVTDLNGQLLSLPVGQPLVDGRRDSLFVQNNTPQTVEVFVACRWEENTEKADLVSLDDNRLSLTEPEDFFAAISASFTTVEFDYGEGWPGTLSEPFPALSFPELTITDFENAEGWPGAFAQPSSSASLLFASTTFSETEFENADGWVGALFQPFSDAEVLFADTSFSETSFESSDAWPGTNNPPTGEVSIVGTLQEYAQLTTNSTVVDTDGTTNSVFSYEWYQAGTDTLLASGDVYTLQPSDVGQNIYVVLKFTDDKGTDEAVSSVEAGPVSPFTFQTFAEEGFEFSEAWPGTQADSSPTPAFAAPVAETFDYAEAWPGTQVDASPEPAFASLFEAGFETVEGWPGLNSAPEGTLSISGSGITGSVHSVVNNVTDADGIDTATITYKWYRENGTIRSTGGSTYTPSSSDAGHNLYVVLTYTDNNGTEEQVTSGLFPNTAGGLIRAASTPELTLDSVVSSGDQNINFTVTVTDDGEGLGYVDELSVVSLAPDGSRFSTRVFSGFNLSTGGTVSFTAPLSDLAVVPGLDYLFAVAGHNSEQLSYGHDSLSNQVEYAHPIAVDPAVAVTAFSPFADFPSFFFEGYESTRLWPDTGGSTSSEPYADYWSFFFKNQVIGVNSTASSHWIGDVVGVATTNTTTTETGIHSRGWKANFPGGHSGGIVEANHYLKSTVLGGGFSSPDPTKNLSLRVFVDTEVNYNSGPDCRHWAGVAAYVDATNTYFAGYTAAIEVVELIDNLSTASGRQYTSDQGISRYRVLTLRGPLPTTATRYDYESYRDRSLLFRGVLGMFLLPWNGGNGYIRLDAVRSQTDTYFNVYFSESTDLDPSLIDWGSVKISHRVATSSLPSGSSYFGVSSGHHSARTTGNNLATSATSGNHTILVDNFHAMVE